MQIINNNEDKCFEDNAFFLDVRTIFIALNVRSNSHEEMVIVY